MAGTQRLQTAVTIGTWGALISVFAPYVLAFDCSKSFFFAIQAWQPMSLGSPSSFVFLAAAIAPAVIWVMDRLNASDAALYTATVVAIVIALVSLVDATPRTAWDCWVGDACPDKMPGLYRYVCLGHLGGYALQLAGAVAVLTLAARRWRERSRSGRSL